MRRPYAPPRVSPLDPADPRATSLREAVVVKVCPNCGRNHDAAGWAGLPLVGYYHDDVVDPPDHPEPTTLELRNCSCRSTIARSVPRRRP